MFACEGVFPNAQDAPALDFEQSIYLAVALAITGNLGVPEFAIGFWTLVMKRTTVPITAINKKREPPRRKKNRVCRGACCSAASL
jgi:hypothetical protein